MTATIETTADLTEYEAEVGLTKHDRCDTGCGAAALVRWASAIGDFVFCGHHSASNSEGLTKAGFVVVEDILETIQHKPNSSAAA